MIGVDTNVLLRLFVNDNAAQYASSQRFFEDRDGRSPAYVSLIVLVELAWVLAVRYGYRQDAILNLVETVALSEDFVLERQTTVLNAVEVCRASASRIADVLVAMVAAADGCTTTMTFDRDAAKRIPGMELLK
jgi:predicted nucleic-acid-binding protein